MAVAIVAGGVLSLAYPGLDWSACAWIALLPLLAVLWTLKPQRAKRCGCLIGYAFGLSFFGSVLLWLDTVSWLGVVVLAAYLAIYPAIWALWAAGAWNPWRRDEPAGVMARSLRSLGYAAALAAMWAGLEVLRSYVFTGFSWNGLGVATHKQVVLMQMADLFGVAGISFVMVFVQAVILQVAMRMWRRARQGVGRWGAHPDFAVAALLVVVGFVYGVGKLRLAGQGEMFPLRVLLTQMNVPQDAAKQLMSAEEIHYGYGEIVETAMNDLAEQHREQLAGGEERALFYPDWLVLPEVALNGRMLTNSAGARAMWPENEDTLKWFRESGCENVVFGLVEMEGAENGGEWHIVENPQVWNSLAWVDANGVKDVYRKRHLVMFGEYIPLIEKLPWLKKIYENQSGAEYQGAYAAGMQHEPIPAEVRGQKFSVIPSICFEDTVAHEARRFVRDEMQVMVNVTNDGWFAQSAAAAQHFANARFRAVELRRPMLRCANTGVSGLISVTGAAKTLVDENGSHFTKGHLFGQLEVPIKPLKSLYQAWGDVPIMVAGALATLLGLWRMRQRRG